jgi:hypothetical protein
MRSVALLAWNYAMSGYGNFLGTNYQVDFTVLIAAHMIVEMGAGLPVSSFGSTMPALLMAEEGWKVDDLAVFTTVGNRVFFQIKSGEVSLSIKDADLRDFARECVQQFRWGRDQKLRYEWSEIATISPAVHLFGSNQVQFKDVQKHLSGSARCRGS